jgi:hypothetical protein
MHRLAYPNGFRCGDQDVVRWDSEYGQVEHQANISTARPISPQKLRGLHCLTVRRERIAF